MPWRDQTHQLLKDRLKLERAETGFALLTRGTEGATMLAAALCVAWRLTAQEQGFFFVFTSLGALQQLSDFGMGYSSLQTASHLRTVGNAARFSRFLEQARRINLVLLSSAALLAFFLGSALFLRTTGTTDAQIRWAGPWIAFVLATLAVQLTNLEIALIEGGRSASEAWRFRWVQELVSGTSFIASLIGGAGLWSLCIYSGVRAALAMAWLKSSRLRVQPIATDAPVGFDWRSEVWPFQWRIGLSLLSGFLIFRSFNPIILMEQGPVVAGRFGMSLAMMNMLLVVSTVWPLSHISHYVGLVGEGQMGRVRHSFWRMFAASTVFIASLACGLLLALWWMRQTGVPFANRIADLMTTGTLLATAVVHHAVHCFAVVVRSERREPLMPISVIGGGLTVIVVWFTARHGGLPEIALAYLACALIGIPVAFSYYRSFMVRGLANHSSDAVSEVLR